MQAQDFGDVLRGGAAIILELDRQKRIEEQRRRAEEAQTRQRTATTSTPQADRALVTQIQAQLAELGYDPGPIDGAMGPRTRAAIVAFQRDKGLPETGAANAATAAAVQTAHTLTARTQSPSQRGDTVATRPSFDCNRASTPPELAICADPRLADLDRELARLYGEANAASANPNTLRSSQREWVGRRDACGSNPACLAAQMENRIATLASIVGTVAGPGLGEPDFADGLRGEIVEIDLTTPVDGEGSSSALETTDLPGLVLADGLPVVALQMSGFAVRGLPREYRSIQADLLRRLVHGELIADGTFDRLTLDAGVTLTPEEYIAVAREVLGDLPDDLERFMTTLSRETDPQRRAVLAGSLWMHTDTLDEFQLRRLTLAIEERGAQRAREMAIEGPLDVLMICAPIGAYDFDTGGFPIEQRAMSGDCGDVQLSNMLGQQRARLQSDLGRVPASIDLPIDEAEAFRASVGDDQAFLAFPARLTARLIDDAQSPVLIEARRIGPYRAVLGADVTRSIYTLDDAGLPRTEGERLEAALSDLSRPWRLWTHAERERILAGAERVDLYELSNIVPGSSSDPLTFTFRLEVPYRDDASDLHGLMRAGGQQTFGSNQARVLSEILGRPTTSVGVANLRAVRPDHPMRNVVVVLPREAEDYALPADLPPLPANGSAEFRALDLAVSEAFVTTITPDTGIPLNGEVLLVFATPTRIVGIQGGRALTENEPEPEIWSAAFPASGDERDGFEAADRIVLARPSDLVHSAAVAADLPVAEIIGYTLNRSFLGGDTFARQDAAAALAAEAQARAPEIGRLIVTARMSLRDYDISREGWTWSWSGLEFASGLSAAEAAIYINPTFPLDRSGARMDLLPMPTEEARALSSRAPHPEYLARVHIAMDPAAVGGGNSVTLPYRVFEIELLEPNANPAIDNPDARIARVVLQMPEPELEAAPDTGFALPVEPESSLRVLGLGIGDPVVSAETALRERMPGGQVYFRSREAQAAMGQVQQGPSDWAPFLEASVYVSEDEQEMVAIYRELPGAGDVVSALTRSRFFGAGQGPIIQDVRSQLIDAYGEPRMDPGDQAGIEGYSGLFAWAEGASDRIEQDGAMVTDPNQSACLRSMSAAAGRLETFFALEQSTRANNWTPPEWTVWVDENDERWFPPLANPVDLAGLMAGGFSECRGTHLFVWIEGGSDGRLTKLRFALVNPVYSAQLADLNRQEIQNRPPAASEGGSQLDL